MTPLRPFKLDDYANWMAPRSLPIVTPDIPTIPPPSISPGGGSNSNVLLYMGLGILALTVIAGGVYLIYQNNELNNQLSNISLEMKKLSSSKEEVQFGNNLLTDSKTNKNGNII